MDIRSEKAELIRRLLRTNKPSIIEKIKQLLEQEDMQEEVPVALAESIQRGLAQVERGETVSHEEVKALYAKWL